MRKTRILFICLHNTARSQIAETYVNYLYGDRFEADSAGYDIGEINPLAAEVMLSLRNPASAGKQTGIDISQNKSKKIFNLYREGKAYNYINSLSDEADGESCPIYPGIGKRISWSFPDIAKLEGTHEERLRQAIEIRDRIKDKIDLFVMEHEEKQLRNTA